MVFAVDLVKAFKPLSRPFAVLTRDAEFAEENQDSDALCGLCDSSDCKERARDGFCSELVKAFNPLPRPFARLTRGAEFAEENQDSDALCVLCDSSDWKERA
jgi:hypothetical protein